MVPWHLHYRLRPRAIIAVITSIIIIVASTDRVVAGLILRILGLSTLGLGSRVRVDWYYLG